MRFAETRLAPVVPSTTPETTARAPRPRWRDLIQTVWAVDPLQCPCCGGTLRRIETFSRPELVEFFLRRHGLWEALVNIPPPPTPPFDIETLEPIDPPWPAIRAWIPADDTDPQAVFPEDIVSTHWVPKEIRLDDERILVFGSSGGSAFPAKKPKPRCQKNIGTAERIPIVLPTENWIA